MCAESIERQWYEQTKKGIFHDLFVYSRVKLNFKDNDYVSALKFFCPGLLGLRIGVENGQFFQAQGT